MVKSDIITMGMSRSGAPKMKDSTTAAMLPAFASPVCSSVSWLMSAVPMASAMSMPTVAVMRNFHQYLAKPMKKVRVTRL